jgi:hypothetical protein
MAWAKFEAFRNNIPSWPTEEVAAEFNDGVPRAACADCQRSVFVHEAFTIDGKLYCASCGAFLSETQNMTAKIRFILCYTENQGNTLFTGQGGSMTNQRLNFAWQTIFNFRTNQLPEYNEDRVREYHEALEIISEVSGQDVTLYRITDAEMKSLPTSIQRRGRIGRFGNIQYRPFKTCPYFVFHRKLEALYAYFNPLSLPEQKNRIGF